MATAKQAGLVWEAKDHLDHFIPFSASACNLIEQSYTKKLTTVHLGDADPRLASVMVNFALMIVENQNTGETNPLRRQIYQGNACSYIESGVAWQWALKNGEWVLFSLEEQLYIEENYQKGSARIDLEEKFPYLKYMVNFKSLLQTNKTTGYVRHIRRSQDVPLSLPLTGESTNGGSTLVNVGASSSRTSPDSSQVSSMDTAQYNQAYNLRMTNSRTRSAGSAQACALAGTSNGPLAVCAEPFLNTDTSKRKKTDGILASSLQSLGRLFGARKKTSSNVQPFDRTVKGVKLPTEIQFSKPTEPPVVMTVLQQHTHSSTEDLHESCSICFEKLSSPSDYDDSDTVLQLRLCGHRYHQGCLTALYKSGVQDGCIQCPYCKQIHGVKYGKQPPGGRMDYYVIPYSVPGFENSNTILIAYYITPGIQTAEHPNPGSVYTCRAFPRVAYLPYNEEGVRVLKLLVTAWERGLIFTVGTSSTSGEENTVVWNEIHHKTEMSSNYSGHGYPDPNYIRNVLEELAVQGVVEEN